MRNLKAILLIFVFGQACAEAPVVDIEDQSSGGQPARASGGQGSGSAQQVGVDMYYQVQMLQEEVRELRGLVEEQAHEIRQLKQRQMDDYRDLDRRLSALIKEGGAPASGAALPESADNGRPEPAARPVPAPREASDSDAERQSYAAAYDLLKDRKVEQATTAFRNHLKNFPDGQYAANAHYWLGEIHLLQNELESARQSFATVVNQFPAHRKAADAMFKLGKVLHLQGEDDRARQMLQKAVDAGGTAAELARAYLRDNFQ